MSDTTERQVHLDEGTLFPDHTPPGSRELLDGFANIGFGLNSELTELLTDHPDVRINRFGGGFMQATSEVAGFINRPRDAHSLEDLSLFERGQTRLSGLYELVEEAGIEGFSWRNLDIDQTMRLRAGHIADPRLRGMLLQLIDEEALRQGRLRVLPAQFEHEEARLLGQMIADVIHPKVDSDEMPILPGAINPKGVPSNCGSAEGYFYDWLGKRDFKSFKSVKPEIRMHVIVADNGIPLMIEKYRMGSSHFALTARPFILNGVQIPPGSLVWLQHASEIVETGPTRTGWGSIRPAKDIPGFYFSRLTPPSVSPNNRGKVFIKESKQEGYYPWSEEPIEAFVAAADAEVTANT